MSAPQPSAVNSVKEVNTTQVLVLAGLLSLDALLAMTGYYFGFPHHDGPALFLAVLCLLFVFSLPLRLRSSITTGRILISASILFPLASLIMPVVLLMADNISSYPYRWTGPAFILARCILLVTGWYWLGRLAFINRCLRSDKSAAPPHSPLPGWLAAVLPPALWLAYLTWAMLPAPKVELYIPVPLSSEESRERIQKFERYLEEYQATMTPEERTTTQRLIAEMGTTPQTRQVTVPFDGTNAFVTRIDVLRIRVAAAMQGYAVSKVLVGQLDGLPLMASVTTENGTQQYMHKDFFENWGIHSGSSTGILRTRYRPYGISLPGFFRTVGNPNPALIPGAGG